MNDPFRLEQGPFKASSQTMDVRHQYGYSRIEGMMQQTAIANAEQSAQMNAIVLNYRPKETCAACSKVKRLPYKRGEQAFPLPVCTDCYVLDRSRFWHLLYGLGLR
jgi:hypothetical protein